MKIKALLTLLVAGALTAGAQSQGYVDGIEYYKAGQYDNARTILERTINDPSTDQTMAYYYMGQVELVKGDRAKALEYFKRGLDLAPENPYNYVGLGAVDLLNGNVSSANSYFKDAQKYGKKNGDVSIAIARAYYNADPVAYDKEITKMVEKARKDTKNTEPAIYIFEGDRLADQKEYGDAATQYEMAINFDANNSEGYVKYANAYFFVNPNFAISKLEELLAKEPQSALAQRELAEKYYEAKHWNKAADLYGRYIQNPNHFPEDKARYSVLLYWGEKYQPSLQVANEILADNPQNFLMQRMRFLNETALQDYPAAVADAQAFFTNNPNGYFTTNDYTTYAEALTGIGEDSLAIVQYELAVKNDPENGDLLKNLSEIYTKNKDFLRAAEVYDAYLQLQENPSINDYFGIAGRYLNVAATSSDNDEQRVKAADRGLEYMDKVLERATPQAPLYQRKARLYIARNGNQPDQNAIDVYQEMTDLLDQDPANMDASNTSALKLYREAYSFGMLYYGNIAKDKDKMAEYTDKFNVVDGILNPKTTSEEEF